MPTPFNSEKIIIHIIKNQEFSSFLVGFDLKDDGTKEYRLKPLVKKLTHVIQEFAFGFHENTHTENTETLRKLTEAANTIYKIDAFHRVKNIYLAEDKAIDDNVEDKYLRRGEFGELILHLLLRDFYNTIPLLSKIYFKDSVGHAVHGFDSVHIHEESKTLWLGESKIYTDGKKGVKELINDIKEHFKTDYLNSEFLLISKKLKHLDNIPEKDFWLNVLTDTRTLKDKLNIINIPLLCTFQSDLFTNYNDENEPAFLKEYNAEMEELWNFFNQINDHPLKANLNIILILFPVQNKKELVKALHTKLSILQRLGE
ncbi:MAG TPA: DUF1837 domain-containing protein [Bacteroidales bacterium]|nr:DUF1837 domain-containing protein [Bacteroidales bacterium]